MKHDGLTFSPPPRRRWVTRPVVAPGGGGGAAVLLLAVDAMPRQDDLSPPALPRDGAL